MASRKHFSTIAIAIGSFLMTVSCQENATLTNSGVTNQRIINYTFDGREGDPIALSIGTRWIANYTSKNPSGVNSQVFGSQIINKILGKTGSMGIRFYYAVDDAGSAKLMLIGADGKGNDLVPTYGIAGRDSFTNIMGGAGPSLMGTEGDSISMEATKRWEAAYVVRNPTGIQAHFFGNEIVNQILSESGCVGIRVYYALNDSGVQQLLLVGVTSTGGNLLPKSESAGRVADDDNTMADVSYPCPTYCTGT
jgi:hypothetical protein